VILKDVEAREPRPVQVKVIGQQFAWHFEYPQQGGRAVRSDELYLPVGRQVEFRLDTVDVIHSFWIPAFRIKQDIPPGVTTETRATPTREGSFDVVCTELCGLGHATMRQSATVVPEEEFTAWLRERGGTGVPAPTTGNPQNQ
jgi:cytochrome c oxidase subunit 2